MMKKYLNYKTVGLQLSLIVASVIVSHNAWSRSPLNVGLPSSVVDAKVMKLIEHQGIQEVGLKKVQEVANTDPMRPITYVNPESIQLSTEANLESEELVEGQDSLAPKEVVYVLESVFVTGALAYARVNGVTLKDHEYIDGFKVHIDGISEIYMTKGEERRDLRMLEQSVRSSIQGSNTINLKQEQVPVINKNKNSTSDDALPVEDIDKHAIEKLADAAT